MPRPLSREAAAFYLGQISPSTVDKLPLRKIPIHGSRVGYDVHDLDQYADNLKNGVSSHSENPWNDL
jgi:hypothetical protein